MEIEDAQLVEVQFEGNNLLELSLSPQNLNSAYRQLVSDGEAGGVDNIETSELLPYLILYYFPFRVFFQRLHERKVRH